MVTPPALNEKARRDQLVNEYLDAKAAAEKYAEIINQLAEAIVKEIGTGNRHEIMPGVGVRVQAPAMSFNAAKAKQVLTAAQFHSCCESKPSATLAVKMLPGALLDQCKVPGEKPSVRSL